MIVILDIIVDSKPYEKADTAARYILKMLNEFRFRHVKILNLQNLEKNSSVYCLPPADKQTCLIASDFSKLFLVRIKYGIKPKNKKEVTEEESKEVLDTIHPDLRKMFDGVMFAYVEFDSEDKKPISFDFLKTE